MSTGSRETHRFGTSPIQVVKLIERPGRHDLREVGVTARCAWGAESNSADLPHETLVRTVHAIAKDHPLDQVEELGLSLNDYLLMAHPGLARLALELRECSWRRLDVGGQEQHHAFARVSGETRVARVLGARDGTSVEAGLEDLRLLRAGGCESPSSPFATDVAARWRYVRPDVSFGLALQGVRQLLLETFVEHPTESPPALLQAMADAVLESVDDVASIQLRLTLRRHAPVDLSAMGLTNDQGIFAPLEGPLEIVEAERSRSDA